MKCQPVICWAQIYVDYKLILTVRWSTITIRVAIQHTSAAVRDLASRKAGAVSRVLIQWSVMPVAAHICLCRGTVGVT